MFWRLFLAHLLGDYLFQPHWIVVNKRRIWVLSLHAAIHFVTMLLLVGITNEGAWIKLLVLAIIHLIMDWAKGLLTELPEINTTLSYVIDQIIHIMILGFVAYWIEGDLALTFTSANVVWLIYASGYLLTTYMWYITERIAFERDRTILAEINGARWSRMIIRAILFTGWLFAGEGLKGGPLVFSFTMPYLSGTYRKRAIVTDIIVTLVIAIGVHLTV
ncbi:MAG: DUF3307 domain-containing protein [Anaerolineaceae bacterium]|nr:MAG: DUF3307 domain-containing protein [Anaerolineaceae bacterium]